MESLLPSESSVLQSPDMFSILIPHLLTTFQQMLLVLALEQYLDSGAIERLSLSPTRAL